MVKVYKVVGNGLIHLDVVLSDTTMVATGLLREGVAPSLFSTQRSGCLLCTNSLQSILES